MKATFEQSVEPLQKENRSVGKAMKHGTKMRCPSCGTGKLFSSYLKVVNTCGHCKTELHHHRADDAPPYFTITIVGHIVLPAMLITEKYYKPDLWIHAAIFIPLTILLCLALLPPIKGAIVGFQWANWMHGFDPKSDEALEEAPLERSL